MTASHHDTANCSGGAEPDWFPGTEGTHFAGVPLRVIGRLDPPAFCGGAPRKRWEAAAAAASLLYRAHDARTVTETQALLEAAAGRLLEAGLLDLAGHASELADSFAAPLQAVRELQDRVAEEAGKLEATYLEMGL
jgi:hypothetical protein